MHSRSNSATSFAAKFDSVVVAPRRAPPTALRLVSGPIPARNKPKHTLPSIPRPAFYPVPVITSGAASRARSRASEDALPYIEVAPARMTLDQLPALMIPSYTGRRGSESGDSSPVSAGSSHRSMPPSPASDRIVRGPWDHSSSIKVSINVESILQHPMPVAVTIGAAR